MKWLISLLSAAGMGLKFLGTFLMAVIARRHHWVLEVIRRPAFIIVAVGVCVCLHGLLAWYAFTHRTRR